MDLKALFQLTYGVYIISSTSNGHDTGCVVNTLQQVTSSPARLSIAVNKENFTHDVIQQSKAFVAMVLLEKTSMELIRCFGFQSSRNTNKFTDYPTLRDAAGLPYLTQEIGARFSCKVVDQMDAGTHTVFLGELTESEILDSSPVMSYAYYHSVKKGKTPPKASSYQPPAAQSAATPDGWECTVCGYIYEGNPLPADFVCPVCGMPSSAFKRVGS